MKHTRKVWSAEVTREERNKCGMKFMERLNGAACNGLL